MIKQWTIKRSHLQQSTLRLVVCIAEHVVNTSMENAQDADGTTKQHGVKFANAV